MNLIKLTSQDGTTAYGGPWEVGTHREIAENKRKPQLCTSGVFHAYRSLELGLLLNPIMGNIQNPIAWTAEGEVEVSDYAKVGCYSLTITGAVEIPAWYSDETRRRDVQVMFAVLCAEAVLSVYESRFPDDDRPRKAIEAAKEYLRAKTRTAADASTDAAYAAHDAANVTDHSDAGAAAYAAAKAAYAAADADDAARANADDATCAAVNTARAAARAAYNAYVATARNIDALDFDALARQAVSIIEATA